MNLEKALNIFDYFKNIDQSFFLAGSARRKVKENLHDVDMIYIGDKIPVIPGLEETVSGHEIVRGVFNGEKIDIYRCDKIYFGAMLNFLTGPKKYNIKMRAKAKYKKLKLNQKGLFDLDNNLIASETEDEIYEAMNLKYKEPELRV